MGAVPQVCNPHHKGRLLLHIFHGSQKGGNVYKSVHTKTFVKSTIHYTLLPHVKNFLPNVQQHMEA